jgi:hypothetical protein
MITPQERPIFVLADQLVQTWLRNGANLLELVKLRRRSDRARAYTRAHGTSSVLAQVYLARAEEARRQRLARLRNGRREAIVLLARTEELLNSACAERRQCLSGRSPTSLSAPPPPLPTSRKYA